MFYSLETTDHQNTFLYSCMTLDGRKTPRRNTFSYQVELPGKSKVRIRRKFLQIVCQVGERRIQGLQGKKMVGAPLPLDGRGRHGNQIKTAEVVREAVKEYVLSFSAQEPHCSRAKIPNRDFLSEELNVEKMYRLYLELHKEQETERAIFDDFNLKFELPRTDTCKNSICFSWK